MHNFVYATFVHAQIMYMKLLCQRCERVGWKNKHARVYGCNVHGIDPRRLLSTIESLCPRRKQGGYNEKRWERREYYVVFTFSQVLQEGERRPDVHREKRRLRGSYERTRRREVERLMGKRVEHVERFVGNHPQLL